jgi:hypothetical protein
MLNPHPQLAPYQQSHDAEGTINPSEKTCSARKFWEPRPAHDQGWKRATRSQNKTGGSRPAH